MLHFEDPRQEPETDPNQPIVTVNHRHEYDDKMPFSTAVMIIILIILIIGLFVIFWMTGGALVGA